MCGDFLTLLLLFSTFFMMEKLLYEMFSFCFLQEPLHLSRLDKVLETAMILTAAKESEQLLQVLNYWSWKESSIPICTCPDSEESRLLPI